jgi:hypothetical protein
MTEQDLICLIVDEVLRRFRDLGDAAKPPEAKTVLVLIPSFIGDTEMLLSCLKNMYPQSVTCAVWENAGMGNTPFKTIRVQAGVNEADIMRSLKQYGEIVLALPTITLLKKIASGDDSGFIEQLVLRAVLQGRKVSCILDYKVPNFKRSTVFQMICDALDALKAMGVNIVSMASEEQKAAGGLALVTEADVGDVHKNGGTFLRLLPGAIVTPLARDKAKELNIAIVNE